MSNSNKNIISNLLAESKNYSNIYDIEKLSQNGQLTNIPVQPLYLSLRKCSTEDLIKYLPELSTDQRSAILDIDLWQKDNLDIFEFEPWIDVYYKLNDELKLEFVKSSQFTLYLKSRFTISTFDAEDPRYPDDDNYFLTDDNLLIFEYDEEFERVDELKNLIRYFYSNMGVENAYAHLFKIVTHSALLMHEDEYRIKQGRLRDYGLLDYFEAQEITHAFHSYDKMNFFIDNKVGATGDLNASSKNQALHKSAIIGFEEDLGDILSDISKIKAQKRSDFIQFSFVRLINSTLSARNALKDSNITFNQIGKETRNFLKLGFSYIKNHRNDVDCIFELFDFIDVYKVGCSLITIEKSILKKHLLKYEFTNDLSQAFLGQKISNLILESFFDVPRLCSIYSRKSQCIESFSLWTEWKLELNFAIETLPFAKGFYESYLSLKSEEKIQDQYYINYDIADIDYESILISSLVNHHSGTYESAENQKIGVTIEDLKSFCLRYFTRDNEAKIVDDKKYSDFLDDFINHYGFEKIINFKNYVTEILKEHLEGYNYSELREDEYSHIGGPIILTIKGH